MKSCYRFCLMTLAATVTMAFGFAQAPVTAGGAELSVPFGSADGQVVVVADYLLFVNADRPESSFALERSNVVSASIQNENVVLQTRERVGDLSQFIFHLDDPMQVGMVVGWAGGATQVGAGAGASQTGAGSNTNPGAIIGEYQARHDHLFRGGCEGKLVITGTQVSFESVTDIDHSRRWDIEDMKEVKRDNPYKLELKPFTGDDYSFELLGGEGMSSAQFKALTDVVTESRRSPSGR